MRNRTNTAVALWMVLALFLAPALTAQSSTDREKQAAQQELTTAEAAFAAAEAAGAATLAPTVMDEARMRLEIARRDWNAVERNDRNAATLRAVEARHAAEAAEAQAALVAANNEIRMLRSSITSAGGTPVAVNLYDPPQAISRGATSMDRVIIAENALSVARSVGGEGVAPDLLQRATEILTTARMLAKHHKQSDNADHLAFIAEMMARRAEFMARRNAIATPLASFRDERARLGSAQLAVSAGDRSARIAAERDLDDMQQRYAQALREGSRTNAELEALKRQLDQQTAALQAIQERERNDEAKRATELQALENSLERQRAEGQLTADALAQREQELQRQREELNRLRTDREASERARLEAEKVRADAIAEAERLRVEAQQQSSELRDQVAAAQARAAQTEADLARAREELARRDAANQQRIATMQQELAKLAETRTSDRGFIVTLPGLFFDTGKSALKAGAKNALAKIADQLRANTDVKVTIEGHTDSVGSDELNQALSDKRAAAVRDYLVSRGLPVERMTVRGLGETAPVATNDTAAGRQQNRRVELIITQGE